MKTTHHNIRTRFSQMINKFVNIFTVCSRQPTTYLIQNPSYCNLYLISTPIIRQRRRRDSDLSSRQINHNNLQLPFYPTNFTFLDQNTFPRRLMPEITLLDCECTSQTNNNMICQVNNDDNRIYQTEAISISSTFFSSSSSSSSCQSSLTIHQCDSISTIPSATMTDIEMLNNRNENMESSSSLSSSPSMPVAQTYFSYLIRPTTPCIFGGEYEEEDDDEFFLTAGGIVHSCPNIYELSMDNQRKLQSCDHLIYFDHRTSLLNDDQDENPKNYLNCYDTELDRYSILPRFQPISSSMSTDSFSSEFELYKERHAMGLSRPYYDNTSSNSSSFLPTTWKSDNYLVVMPFIEQQQRTHLSLLNSIDHRKRSRSFNN